DAHARRDRTGPEREADPGRDRRHRDRGEEREHEQRSDRDGGRRDRGEQQDADACAPTHTVDEPDPERAGRRAHWVPVTAVVCGARREGAVTPADDEPYGEEDDERRDGGLRTTLDGVREIAVGEQDR